MVNLRTVEYLPDGSVYDLTEEQVRKAVALVAAHAKDAEDFKELVSALGMEIA